MLRPWRKLQGWAGGRASAATVPVTGSEWPLLELVTSHGARCLRRKRMEIPRPCVELAPRQVRKQESEALGWEREG